MKNVKRLFTSTIMLYLVALVIASVISCGLLLAEIRLDHSFGQTYLLWNLFLAWIPFILTLWLVQALSRKPWSSWEALLVSMAWLLFLPNTFYMISDFVHLPDLNTDQLLFSVVMFSSFILTALALGLSNLYLVHRELLKRLSHIYAAVLVGSVLLVCSIAIYIGRDLRWNSWDVLTSPSGVLFDLSARLISPGQYSQIVLVVVPFFVLLSSLYVLTWCAARAVRKL